MRWDAFREQQPYSKFNRVIAANFDFSPQEIESIVQFNNLHQREIPYACEDGDAEWYCLFRILRTKYATDTYYCSSLVWRAHLDSGRYMDLDEFIPGVVLPVELLLNSVARDKLCALRW
jgi:hypothetical protein